MIQMAHPWGVELRGGEAEAPRPAHAPWRERLKIEDQQDASVTNVLPLSRPGHFEGAPESVNVLLEKHTALVPKNRLPERYWQRLGWWRF